MPISKYFKGHGEKVMKAMKEEYGEKKGERIFYATANKRKASRSSKHHSACDGEFIDKRRSL